KGESRVHGGGPRVGFVGGEDHGAAGGDIRVPADGNAASRAGIADFTEGAIENLKGAVVAVVAKVDHSAEVVGAGVGKLEGIAGGGEVDVKETGTGEDGVEFGGTGGVEIERGI